MFCYYIFVRHLSTRSRTIGLGLWASLLALSQFSGLVGAIPLLGWAWWRHRLPFRSIAVCLGVTALVVAPHLSNNLRQFDDPFWSTNMHAIWYRNREYMVIKRTGCDGCPSLEGYDPNEDGHKGRRVTAIGYVFGMHSPFEVWSRMLGGYVSLYLVPYGLPKLQTGSDHPVIQFLYFTGLLGVALGPFRELLLVPLLTTNFLAFVLTVGVDPRLLVHTAWIGAFAMAYPIWWTWHNFQRFTGWLPHRSSSTPSGSPH